MSGPGLIQLLAMHILFPFILQTSSGPWISLFPLVIRPSPRKEISLWMACGRELNSTEVIYSLVLGVEAFMEWLEEHLELDTIGYNIAHLGEVLSSEGDPWKSPFFTPWNSFQVLPSTRVLAE